MDGMGSSGPREPGARHWTGPWQWFVFWVVVSAAGLVIPARSLPDQDPVWPAATGLAVFVLLYLSLLWEVFCRPVRSGRGGAGASRLRLLGLGLLAALGVGLEIAYGAGRGWALVMVYVAVAGVLLLTGVRVRLTWLLLVTAVQLAIGVALFMSLSHDVSVIDAVTELTLVAANTLLVSGLILLWERRETLIGQLRRTQSELARTAVQEERLRFSRDLHDLLGHTLSLIVVKAEVVARSGGRDAQTAAREADEIQQIGRRALAEMREAVTGYREREFAAELEAARAALTGAGIQVSVRTTGTPLLAPADSLLGWAVREAATNVLRHSGATHCEIEVTQVDGVATLEVCDDGAGREPPDIIGSGLSGLAGRLSEAGGRLEAGRTASGGWRLAATVPVETAVRQ